MSISFYAPYPGSSRYLLGFSVVEPFLIASCWAAVENRETVTVGLQFRRSNMGPLHVCRTLDIIFSFEGIWI